MNTTRSFSPVACRAMITCLAALSFIPLFISCAAKPLPRALPPSIRKIYVPIFETHAYEPGLEEILTQKTIDEFLIDGRVKIVRPEQADIILSGFLDEVIILTEDTSEDDFVLIKSMEGFVRMTAFGADDIERSNPVLVWNDISSEISFLSDKRFTVETLDVDARRMLMEELAKEIVRAVIEDTPTSFYGEDFEEEDFDIFDDPNRRYRTHDSLRERRKKTRGLPPLKQAF
jgi:hypothetical protein